jgi:uncharacterized protein (DUF934 family)
MPLRDRTGERPDPFTRVAGDDVAGQGHVLAPLERLDATLAARGASQLVGVEIANTTKPEVLAHAFDRLALIAVAFPAFGDGRGFSIAKALRAAGYRGRLRAVGPLIADQFAYALACGFDEVETPDALAARQPMAQWLAALNASPGGLAEGFSLLDARRAARGGLKA